MFKQIKIIGVTAVLAAVVALIIVIIYLIVPFVITLAVVSLLYWIVKNNYAD